MVLCEYSQFTCWSALGCVNACSCNPGAPIPSIADVRFDRLPADIYDFLGSANVQSALSSLPYMWTVRTATTITDVRTVHYHMSSRSSSSANISLHDLISPTLDGLFYTGCSEPSIANAIRKSRIAISRSPRCGAQEISSWPVTLSFFYLHFFLNQCFDATQRDRMRAQNLHKLRTSTRY